MGLIFGMNIVSKQTYLNYCEEYPRAAEFLKAWYLEASAAEWSSPQDVKDRYANVSIIANNCVVFNIKGNDYRLIAGINYSFRALYIKFFGTHAEYDKVDAATVELRRK
ncbi:type II toxin-antitoxin system HigB family toxin [Trinickia sp. NRRL B-1857]|uniref:type II toxin-antitoxin system HigB family toxin n=1 Tax=Trinickia sp. NRRL B-1857 TaxID=3162879 RepID=UPI003D2844A8